MSAEISESLLAGIVRATVEAVAPERIVLFGSHARGDAGPDSDVDLMVIERSPFGPDHSRREEIRRIRRALWNVRIPVDILVFSQDEVEFWRDSPNHVIGQTLREGRTLYERP